MGSKGYTDVLIAVILFVTIVAVIGMFAISKYSKGSELSERYSIPFNPILMSFDETFPIRDVLGKAITLKEGSIKINEIKKGESDVLIVTELVTGSVVLRFDLGKEIFSSIDPEYVRVCDVSGIEYPEVDDFNAVTKGVFYDVLNNWIYVKMDEDDVVIKNSKNEVLEEFLAASCVLEDKEDENYCFVEEGKDEGAVNNKGTDGIESWENF